VQAVTNRVGGAGFFGKVPTHGDFVSRRLPQDFIAPWDAWMQAGLAESRARLGQGWLPMYLNSPIWRFALGAGVCGPQAWAGVMMPSVDRVGRYFPLTVAAVLGGDGVDPRHGPAGDEAWYGRIETLALSCLKNDFSLARFDAALAASTQPQGLVDSTAEDALPRKGNVRFWRDGMPGRAAPPLPDSGLLTVEALVGLLGGIDKEGFYAYKDEK
jgi:type VI secretion system protein ImpM